MTQDELNAKFDKMPMGEEKAEMALRVFLKNPYHKEDYDKAPEGAKELLKWRYYNSLSDGENEDETKLIGDKLEKAKRQLDEGGWDYLISLETTPTTRGMLKKQKQEYLQ